MRTVAHEMEEAMNANFTGADSASVNLSIIGATAFTSTELNVLVPDITEGKLHTKEQHFMLAMVNSLGMETVFLCRSLISSSVMFSFSFTLFSSSITRAML
jgi:hypothetical protein